VSWKYLIIFAIYDFDENLFVSLKETYSLLFFIPLQHPFHFMPVLIFWFLRIGGVCRVYNGRGLLNEHISKSPHTPAAHLRTLGVTSVCRGTQVYNLRLRC
jgi:hypothetical protein